MQAVLNRESEEEGTPRGVGRAMKRYTNSVVKTDLAAYLRCVQCMCKIDLNLNFILTLCLCRPIGACAVQKQTLGLTGLDVKVVGSHPTWVLRTELWSSERAAHSPNY